MKARSNDDPNTPKSTTAYMECVIDFGLTMGVRLDIVEGGMLI